MLLVVAAVAAAIVLLLGGGDGDSTVAPAAGEFTLTYPENWNALTDAQLKALQNPPLVLIRREDGKAVIVVRRDKPGIPDAAQLARDLEKEFKQRLPDYKRVSASIITLPAGRAFFYSYVREKKGTLHTVVIVPSGDRSYVFNTVSVPGDEQVADEVGAIIKSLKVNAS